MIISSIILFLQFPCPQCYQFSRDLTVDISLRHEISLLSLTLSIKGVSITRLPVGDLWPWSDLQNDQKLRFPKKLLTSKFGWNPTRWSKVMPVFKTLWMDGQKRSLTLKVTFDLEVTFIKTKSWGLLRSFFHPNLVKIGQERAKLCQFLYRYRRTAQKVYWPL